MDVFSSASLELGFFLWYTSALDVMKVTAFNWRQRYEVMFFWVREGASYKTLPPFLELFFPNNNTNTIFTFKNLQSWI